MINLHQQREKLGLSWHLIYKEGFSEKPRGRIVSAFLSTTFTQLPIAELLKKRKKRPGLRKAQWLAKQKSLQPNEKENNLRQYQVVGICMALRRRGLNTTVVLRNTLSLFSFEYILPVYSPTINIIGIQENDLVSLDYKKARRYILQNKSPIHSEVPFEYLVYDLDNNDYKEYRDMNWS